MSLTVHTTETAPEGSGTLLEKINGKYGFVPNLMGVYAGSPEVLGAHIALSDLFDQTSLTAVERQVIRLAVSRVNSCEYCMAAESTVAGMMQVPEEIVLSVRNAGSISDPKLEALRRFTEAIIEKRGKVSQEDKGGFLAAGYTEQNVLEVLLGVTIKTLSNYTNHIAETPIDDAFAPAKWSAATA